jgi:hypothetical protein
MAVRTLANTEKAAFFTSALAGAQPACFASRAPPPRPDQSSPWRSSCCSAGDCVKVFIAGHLTWGGGAVVQLYQIQGGRDATAPPEGGTNRWSDLGFCGKSHRSRHYSQIP